MPIMIDSWQPDALEHCWTMVDGFDVNKKVIQTIDTKIEVDELEGHPTFMYRYSDNIGSETGLSLAADITHSIDGMVVRELCRRCNYDLGQLRKARELLLQRLHWTGPIPTKLTRIEKLRNDHNFVSLVGIENLTKKRLMKMTIDYVGDLLLLINDSLKHPTFQVVCIHDEFKCHPNYMNHIRQTYIDIFAEMADSTILDAILSSIHNKPVHIPKLSNDLAKEIRQSEYSLS